VLQIQSINLYSGKEVTVSEDEEYKRVDFDKIKTLKPAFQKDGNDDLICLSVCDDIFYWVVWLRW